MIVMLTTLLIIACSTNNNDVLLININLSVAFMINTGHFHFQLWCSMNSPKPHGSYWITFIIICHVQRARLLFTNSFKII